MQSVTANPGDMVGTVDGTTKSDFTTDSAVHWITTGAGPGASPTAAQIAGA